MAYIDSDKIRLNSLSWIDGNGDILVPLADVKKAIAQVPLEDVVKVIRCYECKNNSGIGCPFYDDINRSDTDFCSYGERIQGINYDDRSSN